MKKYLHLKTGHIYWVIEKVAINCTNKDNGTIMVVYRNNQGMFFVREAIEFNEKFKEV